MFLLFLPLNMYYFILKWEYNHHLFNILVNKPIYKLFPQL